MRARALQQTAPCPLGGHETQSATCKVRQVGILTATRDRDAPAGTRAFAAGARAVPRRVVLRQRMTCDAASLQFIKGINEPTVPEVKLMRGRCGAQRLAPFRPEAVPVCALKTHVRRRVHAHHPFASPPHALLAPGLATAEAPPSSLKIPASSRRPARTETSPVRTVVSNRRCVMGLPASPQRFPPPGHYPPRAARRRSPVTPPPHPGDATPAAPRARTRGRR